MCKQVDALVSFLNSQGGSWTGPRGTLAVKSLNKGVVPKKKARALEVLERAVHDGKVKKVGHRDASITVTVISSASSAS